MATTDSAAITAAVTATITQVVTKTVNATASATTTAGRAASQGGILEGRIPTHFEPKSPITLFIIQAVIVISLTRLLHWPLSKMRQPRVIAEVITGIVLGPSIMGRIPNFTANIFPTASMPPFTLVANIGLVLFLFLVGVEVDLRYLMSNWRVALSVGAAGMILPFGLGVAIAWGLYHQFHDEPNLVPISFGLFALFIGIAIAITAFPVLCRILTSLSLLSTPVGVIVLSAGVANDVVGWILLALCVALVNSGGGLTALYILLVAIGYSLFIAYPVRFAFHWVLRRTGAISNGPSQTIVALTLFLVFASAFFTDVIGIHAIFGAFMIGLICPHQGGFAIKITEKIEDLVSTLFLPLYFALSGLSTNLGLLDTGMTWAYVIGVTCVAFFGKVIGGTTAAKLNGMLWGESFTIGCLMSCKGLVELIVLNIGLQARILSTRTFTIFVVMALLTTFATTPLTIWFYPPEYQRKVELWKQGKINWDGTPTAPSEGSVKSDDEVKTDATNKMLVYLRLDGLPSLFNIVSLFTGGSSQRATSTKADGFYGSEVDSNEVPAAKAGVTVTQSPIVPYKSSVEFERPLRIHGLRLTELTERDSSVMRVSELQEYASRDPIIKAFGLAAAASRSSRNVTVSGQIAVVPEESFSSTLVARAQEIRSDFILVPWSETGTVSEHDPVLDVNSSNDPLNNHQYAALTTDIFDAAASIASVGVFIDKALLNRSSLNRTISAAGNSVMAERTASRHQLTRSMTGMSLRENDQPVMFRSADSRGRHQIRALFRNNTDDLQAVKLALQLAKNEDVEVRVVKLPVADDAAETLVHNEFEKIRSSLPASLKERIVFDDLDQSNIDAVAAALILNRSTEVGDVTILIGRAASSDTAVPAGHITSPDPRGVMSPLSAKSNVNFGPRGPHAGASSSGETSHALGQIAADLLSQMTQMDVAVSMLVVQAKTGRKGKEQAAGVGEAAVVAPAALNRKDSFVSSVSTQTPGAPATTTGTAPATPATPGVPTAKSPAITSTETAG